MVHPSTPTGAPEQCRCGRPLYGPLAESLLPRIRRAAEGPHGITFVGSAAGGPDVPPVRVSWKQLHREACAAAAALQARGVAPGDHVALLGPTSRALVTTVQAIWLAGGCMIMLPIPLRFASVDDFMRQTRALLKSGQVSCCLSIRKWPPSMSPPRATRRCFPSMRFSPGARGCRRRMITGPCPMIPAALPCCSSPRAPPRSRKE